jgi:ABC-type transporter Mla MlaB component
MELQGVLFFGNAETLAETVRDVLEAGTMVLLDMEGISDIDVSGAGVLSAMTARARTRGRIVAVSNLSPRRLPPGLFAAGGTMIFPDTDSGLEWMEEQSLIAAGSSGDGGHVTLDRHDLTRDFAPDELAILAARLKSRDFAAGEILCAQGDEADCMWLLTRGTVSVVVPVTDSRTRRLANLGPGTTVGEMALFEAGPRSATVVADMDVSTYELSRSAFETIFRGNPPIALKVQRYFTLEMARRLRNCDRELTAGHRPPRPLTGITASGPEPAPPAR